MTTSIYQPEHEAFRGSVRTFLEREVVPHFNEWEKSGKVPHDFYTKVGDLGLFGLRVPEEYGGAADWRTASCISRCGPRNAAARVWLSGGSGGDPCEPRHSLHPRQRFPQSRRSAGCRTWSTDVAWAPSR